tara:strand:+ start:86 stop:379 length:294 start_codon:yes stop_codon:yes gene_type:complete
LAKFLNICENNLATFLLSIYIQKWIIKVAKLQKVAKLIINLFVSVVTILLVGKVVGLNTLRPKNTSRNRYPKVIHPKWITKKLQIGSFASVVKAISL